MVREKPEVVFEIQLLVPTGDTLDIVSYQKHIRANVKNVKELEGLFQVLRQCFDNARGDRKR